jgi:uncharacterized repeat protein (TIGR01451 family)
MTFRTAALAATTALALLTAAPTALAAGGAGGGGAAGGGGVAATGGADLQVTGSSFSNIHPGQNVAYNFQIKNNGPSDASAVTLTDQLPVGTMSGYGVVINPSSQSSCATSSDASGTSTVTCSVFSIPKGGQQNIQVNAVAPNVTSTFSNTGTVASATADPKPANNSVTITNNVSAVTCALPAGQTTLNGYVMWENKDANGIPLSFELDVAGQQYLVLNNFVDFSTPFTRMINLNCALVPVQFMSVSNFVNVTGTIDSEVLPGDTQPTLVIHSSVVQLPTFLDGA